MFAAPPDPHRHRRRLASMLLVGVLHAGLLFLLWALAPSPMRLLEPKRGATLITLVPEAESEAPAPTPQADRRQAPASAQAASARAEAAPPPPRVQLPAAATQGWSFELMPGMEKFDLASLPRAAAPPGGGAGAGESAAADIGGKVPGRDRLFPAQWQRKPSRAELAAYLPPGLRQTGFGIIACRTVENFRVEDCEELDQSPGSGLAGAVRQAAWQFRVLPPRVGGRSLVGAWVRIRIDYSEGQPEA
ncbi:hypothetical protein E2493_04430 [Sphingomonas parva]|uniref:TonB C-terminal domain-containing protein n=1 Tax=Sphingomonas parva TaxID=2555898 RepID=A0A4Y8ZWD2_9SPHN|nr:hypothetical protein [Sphingomonas parva]TFI59445.1 hypothetical protein E2493_04430 [Sphingomonas parva]